VRTVNIHEAKTHLSRLIAQAVEGEPFVIAKAGRALVKVSVLDASTAAPVRRVGFLLNQFKVPADFDQMGASEIEALFAAPGPAVPVRSSKRQPAKRCP
jgi:antitoxin (DNA-binding transcriptional repressor) of toxin-antitoxin stability system